MKDNSVRQSLTMITQFGINMLVPMLLCMLLGYWIDGFFGTSVFTIVLFFVGALAGFTNIYKLARGIYSKKREGDEDDASQVISRLRDERELRSDPRSKKNSDEKT